jgi:SAM-dependent methyltransferase
MNLSDITKQQHPPEPWAEGDNIPWNDPGFSERMLKEHLSQNHDRASRRFETIDRHVGWIHEEVLQAKAAKILELTCGPGLYTSRLARLGHQCVGIDYAPAAIEYAKKAASSHDSSCVYRMEDVRQAHYGGPYGLVMMINGQFNVFRRQEARAILDKGYAALVSGGAILLEPQRCETVENAGRAGRSWYSCDQGGGLFSARPHICIQESFWHPEAQSTTERFFIIDTETGDVTRHAMTTEAMTEEQFRGILAEAGFEDIQFFRSLAGNEVNDESQSVNLTIVARKL